MRMVDADEIRKKAVPHTRGDHGYSADIRKWAVLVGDIDDAPTIDAVEVVRCKDCKHGWKNCATGNIYCQRDGRNSYEMIFKPDDFCSYGERRGDG